MQDDDAAPDEKPRVKRLKAWEEGPMVKVTYANLTRSSYQRLQELLRGWAAQEHALEGLPHLSKGESTVSGHSIFFPAPPSHSGASVVPISSWWADYPRSGIAGPASGQDAAQPQLSLSQRLVETDDVPSYDRADGMLLEGTVGSATDDVRRSAADSLSGARCFNCGSYTHTMRACNRPRDNTAIAAARAEHAAKSAGDGAGPKRYHGLTRAEKKQQRFEGLEPGVLCPELRYALGMQELDPPPWLDRMRELGYPPGYLEEASEDGESDSGEDSDILPIFTDATEDSSAAAAEDVAYIKKPAKKAKVEKRSIQSDGEAAPGTEADGERNGSEDGEIEAEDLEPEDIAGASSSQGQKKREFHQKVQFPGINAPIPEGASKRRWEPRQDVQLAHHRSYSDSQMRGYDGYGYGRRSYPQYYDHDRAASPVTPVWDWSLGLRPQGAYGAYDAHVRRSYDARSSSRDMDRGSSRRSNGDRHRPRDDYSPIRDSFDDDMDFSD